MRRLKAEAPYLALFRQMKYRAKEWKLPFAVFKKIILSPCFYCGAEPSNDLFGSVGERHCHGRDRIKYQGIDRVNASLGYLVNNVVPSCWICNRLKSNLDLEGMICRFTSMLPKAMALYAEELTLHKEEGLRPSLVKWFESVEKITD